MMMVMTMMLIARLRCDIFMNGNSYLFLLKFVKILLEVFADLCNYSWERCMNVL
jgi:hypothetical protein